MNWRRTSQEQIAEKQAVEKKAAASEAEEAAQPAEDFKPIAAPEKEYKYPSVDLMESAANTSSGITQKEISEKVELLQKTLKTSASKAILLRSASVRLSPAMNSSQRPG